LKLVGIEIRLLVAIGGWFSKYMLARAA
jgi:hypothetical protein